MQVSLDLVNLFLYASQQLGVMLGVGAQTILLITYAISVRDGVVDSKESQIARAVTKAILAGLSIMVLSGLAIAVLHFLMGQWFVLLAPAFLFKWALIVFLIVATFVWRKSPFPDFIWEGIIGASWYALFMVHIIAPVASWFDLIVLYVVWVAGFLLLWSAGVFMTHKKEKKVAPAQPLLAKPISSAPKEEKKVEEKKPEPKPTPPPPAPIIQPKPVVAAAPVNLPIIKPEPEKKSLPVITTVLPPQPAFAPPPQPPKPPTPPPAPEALKPAVEEHFGLPAVRVMPRTKEDLTKHI